MRVYHLSSSQSKPCYVCGKETAHYKVYEQSNITISVPLCDNTVYPNCYSEFGIYRKALQFVADVKQIIRTEMTGDEKH